MVIHCVTHQYTLCIYIVLHLFTLYIHCVTNIHCGDTQMYIGVLHNVYIYIVYIHCGVFPTLGFCICDTRKSPSCRSCRPWLCCFLGRTSQLPCPWYWCCSTPPLPWEQSVYKYDYYYYQTSDTPMLGAFVATGYGAHARFRCALFLSIFK